MQIGLGIGIPFTKSQVWLAVQAVFTPAKLFESGANGLWLDPSDLTTMFQDSAGTTLVTALEQPVGLILDKSKGLVLGPELVTNGTFDTDVSGWAATAGANLSWVAGSANVSFNAIADVGISQVFTRPSGYSIVTATITRNFTGATSVNLSLGGYVHQKAIALGETITLSVLSYRATAGLSTVLVRTAVGTPTGDFTVDNISVRELPGNHAYQTTSTKRPALSARVNLLTKTEDFSDTAWSKSGTSAMNADTILETNTSGVHRASQSRTVPATKLCLYAEFYPAGRSSCAMNLFDNSGGTTRASAVFSIVGAGSIISGSTVLNKISLLPDGWYGCYIESAAAFTAGSTTANIGVTNGAAEVYIGDETKGVRVRKVDLRPIGTGVNLPAYQKVNTATDYDIVGFPMYLKFDGIDDSMQTNSIDFTATDKMTVAAGVRKLSDAATGLLCELSTNVNTGSFYIAAPELTGASGNYTFKNSGTIFPAPVTSGTLLAPRTNVLSAVGNISAPSAILRVNGTQAEISTADQGTGNYGNYPLYIGARAGTSLFFNGNLYNLIVRGAQSTAAQIESTEKWVNGKTAAF